MENVMSADLIKFDGMPQLPVNEDEFNKEVSVGNYLPRIQVVDSNSRVCKKKQAEAGSYAFIKSEDDVIDLSNQFDALIIHVRFTAIDTSGDTPVFCHDKESATYENIVERSGGTDSGCLYGPEFLLYVPSMKAFATFFCASATARRESKNIYKLIKRGATFKTHYIEKGRYSWYGPLVIECSTPMELPDMEEIKKVATEFATDKGNTPEVATGEERDR